MTDDTLLTQERDRDLRPCRPPVTREAARGCGYSGRECHRCGSLRIRGTGSPGGCGFCEDCGEMTGGCQ